MKAYDASKVRNWCKSVLMCYKIREKDAEAISAMLVEADLRNIFSHGAAGGSGLDDIIMKIQYGGINPDYKLYIPSLKERKYPAILNINADGGPGHSLSMKCVNLVKKLARKYGTAKVYLYNSTHFGAAGIYSEMIAQEKDLIGIVTCITPGWMKPYCKDKSNAASKRIGTNPIAWSTPYNHGIITIDIATSQRAASVALNAGKSNQGKERAEDMISVPSDYLIDLEGNEVVYPESPEYVRNCSLFPLGGKNFGYKGYGLSVSIELEHVAGGCENTDIIPGCKTSEGRVGQIFEAVSIDSVYDRETVLSKISNVVSNILECGGGNAKLPGQIEQEYRNRHLKEGIPYSDAQVERLIKIGKCAGIQFDL